MKRSCSWPQIVNPKLKANSNECGQEEIVKLLKEELTNCEKNRIVWDVNLKLLEEQKKNLHSQNCILLQKNRSYCLQISILNDEKNDHKLQIQDLESRLATLEKKFRQTEKEKEALFSDLGLQRQAFSELIKSKEELEKRLMIVREADKVEMNMNHNMESLDSLEESDILRHQVDVMEQELDARKEDAIQLQVLRLENKELQIRISELVQQRVDRQEERNSELREEFENMNRENDLRPTVESSSSWQSLTSHLSDNTFVYPAGNKPATTPTPICLTENTDDFFSPQTNRTPNKIKSLSYFSEFIQFTVIAVKMSFPNISVCSDDLIERAKKVPFYRVHDVLSRFMSKKQKYQQMCRDEELKRAKALLQESKPLPISNEQPSLFGKVSGLFGGWSS